jgi:hypothetical protein
MESILERYINVDACWITLVLIHPSQIHVQVIYNCSHGDNATIDYLTEVYI